MSRREALSALSVAAVGAVAGCSASDPGRIRIAETVLRDEVTPVRLEGFASETRVTVTAGATFGDASVASRTTVTTDGDGAAVVGDTDDSTGAMEWLWSMSPAVTLPETPSAEGADDESPVPSFTVRLTARVDGERVATATQTRRHVARRVERRSVRRDDLVGELFVPGGSGPHPGALVLHGSGGDPLVSWGRLLASHGIAALAVDYFGPAAGNERALARVPLSYFARAARMLRNTDHVRGDSVGIVGVSRGSEAALLTGVHYDWVDAVVALAPSVYVWRGIEPGVPAWTRDGEAVPYLDFPNDDGDRILEPEFREALRRADDEAVSEATIPVERVNAPTLFVSGADDRLWPSATFADRAVRRLNDHDASHEYRHLSYDGAGHAVAIPPFVPMWWTTETPRYVLGGTAAANARAVAEAWPETLSFLQDALGR